VFNVYQYDFSASLGFQWQMYGLSQLLTLADETEVHLDNVTSLGVLGFFGGGPGAQTGGGGGSVAQKGPTITAAPFQPWYKNSCITGALGDAALQVGIDAIGLIPEAGGIARVIGHQAGYVGVVADKSGSKIIKAVGGSTSTASGLAGLDATSSEGLVSTGLTVVGFIPGAGQVASGHSIGWDVYRAAKAIRKCK
jgi:hypothetical protein